jgi:radical SAM protein with 4Fe4S-binding SPASM domain
MFFSRLKNLRTNEKDLFSNGSICKEKKRHDLCQACDVRDICNGDCYKLPWQGEVCAAPKSIMRQMATDQNYEDYEMLI